MDVPNLHVRFPRAKNSPAKTPRPVDRAVPPPCADARLAARARQVIKLMQSFKSKEFVKEAFAWRHYYWCLSAQRLCVSYSLPPTRLASDACLCSPGT
jgi:hypothetical protein